MKTFLTVLALSLFLDVANAAETFFTGAYYATKAPTTLQRQAGLIEMSLLDDGVCRIYCWYNGFLAVLASGEYVTQKNGSIKISAMEAGLTYTFTFKGIAKGGFVSGTWSTDGGVFKGKWQATLP